MTTKETSLLAVWFVFVFIVIMEWIFGRRGDGHEA
jgi:hypothetical protein